MESQLALKLGEMLRETESREEKACAKEKEFGDRLLKVQEREVNAKSWEAEIRKESALLQDYRDTATERRRNQDLLNLAKKERADFEDQRNLIAKEQAGAWEEIRKTKIDLTFKMESLSKKEAELNEVAETLRDEKMKHHERVIKDLSELELKKMRAS